MPFAGPIVGGALAALVALLDGSVTKALIAVVIFTLIQQLDNHIITPLVQRARVQLSPMVIVLALIIGGSLAGLLGRAGGGAVDRRDSDRRWPPLENPDARSVVGWRHPSA